jgi:predicted HAD superfamily phosphohydrolase YqeG
MKQFHTDFFIDRLVKEWLSHERLIIACDLDDTIIPYNPELTESCEEVVNLILDCQEEGIWFVINTAREEYKLQESAAEVEALGIKVHGINKMPLHWDIAYGLAGKVYANIFLDDRGGLECTKHQLRKALEIVKQVREQRRLQNI